MIFVFNTFCNCFTIFATQILAAGDPAMMAKVVAFKDELAEKIDKANRDLAAIKMPFKVPKYALRTSL